ncbi:AbrB/MazE/SpoVT family DNA-binding domain-containing protein [Sporosarcina gallistercoris]|uniref:AbrB/MazE/SpoVT family DNA-binding domain-containing protein n=1 Tax=Sporosarcina gallistercoris TaxID=2762245 RepID=A0ABR8PI36_9BACL|nr:AbrB/MazE/SpoVT family DNA-binding domain-containing protein [Sporosarcina gallistercoris]MBD7907825.1 AbrB/MazE/SpoVT family DNA-binding domain-containing protein [Sporosarcina gallistercoris]
MKSLSIIRKVDHLGRIVIPIELRETMKLPEGQPLEFFTEDENIILRSYKIREACVITGEITPDNFELSNGMFVSPSGAEIILEEVKQGFRM